MAKNVHVFVGRYRVHISLSESRVLRVSEGKQLICHLVLCPESMFMITSNVESL